MKTIIGVLFISIGISMMIIYLNLFYYGYSLLDYIWYVVKSMEFYLFLIGLWLIKRR